MVYYPSLYFPGQSFGCSETNKKQIFFVNNFTYKKVKILTFASWQMLTDQISFPCFNCIVSQIIRDFNTWVIIFVSSPTVHFQNFMKKTSVMGTGSECTLECRVELEFQISHFRYFATKEPANVKKHHYLHYITLLLVTKRQGICFQLIISLLEQ